MLLFLHPCYGRHCLQACGNSPFLSQLRPGRSPGLFLLNEHWLVRSYSAENDSDGWFSRWTCKTSGLKSLQPNCLVKLGINGNSKYQPFLGEHQPKDAPSAVNKHLENAHQSVLTAWEWKIGKTLAWFPSKCKVNLLKVCKTNKNIFLSELGAFPWNGWGRLITSEDSGIRNVP